MIDLIKLILFLVFLFCVFYITIDVFKTYLTPKPRKTDMPNQHSKYMTTIKDGRNIRARDYWDSLDQLTKSIHDLNNIYEVYLSQGCKITIETRD